MRYYRLPPGAGLGALLVALFIIFALVFIPARVAGESFERLGLSMLQGVVVLGVMLLWRTVAVTVHVSKRLVPLLVMPSMRSMLLRMQGVEPEQEHTGELVPQRIALGAGGCIVPLLMCLYFLANTPDLASAWPWMAAAALVVGGVCFATIKPSPTTGVQVPLFVPPAATLVASLVLKGQSFAPQAAYVGTVLGILISTGVVPLLLPRMRNRIETPRFTIGGPGVFGGLFLACLAAGLFS